MKKGLQGSILITVLLPLLVITQSCMVATKEIAITPQVIEKVGDKGKINWSEGYIEAIGIGTPPDRYIGTPHARPMALRAARVDAYRNLLEITTGVRVDSTTVVKDVTVGNVLINTQVENLVKEAKIVNQEYMSDRTKLIVRMPMTGVFSQIIMPKELDEQSDAALPDVQVAPAPVAVGYTGMVVDARGLEALPAMCPKVIDESGREVYGSMNADRECAVQQGMSGYAEDLTAAQSNPRVKNNPIIVKGIKTEGPGKSDIVISNTDAEKIRSASDNLTFLKKCRVMIVLD